MGEQQVFRRTASCRRRPPPAATRRSARHRSARKPGSKVSGTSAGRVSVDGEAELLGDAVAEGGRAHLGDRLAARGDDQRSRRQRAAHRCRCRNRHRSCAPPRSRRRGAAATPAARISPSSMLDDLGRRIVAEQLPLALVVPGDAVALDQGDEILAACSGTAPTGRISDWPTDTCSGAGIDIGEIAAPAARDADLLARRRGCAR